MNLVTALAVVIGVIGGLLTWLYLGPAAALNLQIWATFIGAASFFHCGGDDAALRNSTIANIWGALIASVALFAVVKIGVSPITAGLCVGITVIILILGAHVPVLASIPAGVYGYASTAAFALLAAKTDVIVSGGLGDNPFLTVGLSLIIGNVYGWISGKIAGAIAS